MKNHKLESRTQKQNKEISSKFCLLNSIFAQHHCPQNPERFLAQRVTSD